MKAISSLAIGLIIGLVIGLAVGYVIVHKGVDTLQSAPTPTSTLTPATTPYPSPSLSLSPTPTPTPVEESKQAYRIEITVWSWWKGVILVRNSSGDDIYREYIDINGTTKRQKGTTITYKVEAGVEDTIWVEAYWVGNPDDETWVIVSIEEDRLFGETLCTVFDDQEILFRYIIKTGEVKKGL